MLVTRRLVLALGAAVPLALTGTTALTADAYPTHFITMIVPYAAGGPTDTVGRLLSRADDPRAGPAGGRGERWRGQRYDRCRARGQGGPGWLYLDAAHFRPGHERLLYRKLPYGFHAAFAPIGVVTVMPMTVVGKADLPPNSAGELLDYIRTNKNKVTNGNAWRRRSLTPVRHAVDEHAGHADDHWFPTRGPGRR